MVKLEFDSDITPGGRSISWIFLVAGGAMVGFAAGIMGGGGGFLTFPIFVYVLGVSSMFGIMYMSEGWGMRLEH